MPPKKKIQQRHTTDSNAPSADQTVLRPEFIALEQKKNAGETHRGRGLQETTHGFYFEIQLLMLTSLNIFNMNENPFYIAPGYKQAGDFDDVTLFYRDGSSKDFDCILLQSKHSRKDRQIEEKDLTLDKGPFSLANYFKSYKEVMEWKDRRLLGHTDVRNHRCTVKYAMLCSNCSLDPSLINHKGITELKDPPKNIFHDDILKGVKFYQFNKSFLDEKIGDNSQDFCDHLIYALQFPKIEEMNSILSNRLCAIISKLYDEPSNKTNRPHRDENVWLANYLGWLLNCFANVIDPDQCCYIDRIKIDTKLKHMLSNEKVLIYNTLTYRLTKQSIFGQILPVRRWSEKMGSFLEDKNIPVICCCVPDGQPVRWTTAQLYIYLTGSDMATVDNVFILEFNEAVKKNDDLKLLASEDKKYFFIIETEETISSCSRKKFCIKNNSSSKFFIVNNYHECDNCVGCDRLHYSDLREFSEKLISLPSNERSIYLQDFIKPMENKKIKTELMNTNVIKHLLSTQTLTIKNSPVSTLSAISLLPHISRKLRLYNGLDVKEIIKTQTTFNKNESCIFVYKQSESQIIEFNDKSQFKSLNNPSKEQIEETISTLKDFAYIHLIEIESSTNENIGILKKTIGNKTSSIGSCINRYINTKSWEIIDDDKFLLRTHITVLAAEPGMGKSYFVRWLLSNQRLRFFNEDLPISTPTFVWKILVDLRDYQELFVKTNQIESLENAVKFLVTNFDGNEDDKQLSEHFLLQFLKGLSNEHALIIILDGFDEISVDAQKKCIKLIQSLNTNTTHLIRIIITTRKYALSSLTEALIINKYDFEPITKHQQINYLNEYWHGSRDRAEYFIERLNTYVNNTAESLLGTPLLCQIIAVAFALVDNQQPNSNASGNDHNNLIKLNVITIFDKFIERQYSKLLNNYHLNTPNPFSKSMFDCFIRVHARTAFCVLRPNIYHLWFEEEEELPAVTVSEIINGGGIAESIGNPKVIHFIHQTFAEYFEAKLYINILSKSRKDKDPLVRDCKNHLKYAMLCPEYKVTKLFLDSYFDIAHHPVFHDQWISITESWLFVPPSKKNGPIIWWESPPPLFNARNNEQNVNDDSNYFASYNVWSNSRDIKGLKKLFKFGEFYNRANFEEAVKLIANETMDNQHFTMASSLCHHLFLLLKSDRQIIVGEIRKSVLKNDLSNESFELRVWLKLYSYVDEMNVDDTSEPRALFHKHIWLFNTVFPRLFSCDRDDEYVSASYKQCTAPCVADLLLATDKEGDKFVAQQMKNIQSLEREINTNCISLVTKVVPSVCINVNQLLRASSSSPSRISNEFISSAMIHAYALAKNYLNECAAIDTLNILWNKRKEDQQYFIEYLFSTQSGCSLDTYLTTITEKITESVKSKCKEEEYYSPLHTFFEPFFGVHLARLSDELLLLIPDMINGLIRLETAAERGLCQHETLHVLVSKLLTTLDWAFPEKQMLVHIDVPIALNFLCELMSENTLRFDPPLNQWYKSIITLIQRCLDQLSHSDQPPPYTIESVCQLFFSFARRSNLAIIADIDETKFVLHQTMKPEQFLAEIIANNSNQFKNISEKIHILTKNDNGTKEQQSVEHFSGTSENISGRDSEIEDKSYAESEFDTDANTEDGND
ncbi:unnamed protein product [Rotaria socialis]|uniref:NACHT domain-containing protein n=1 Tax=Rotaria socialis TaxID=392032 RepID=A0A817PR39_9BILA|nr:unnamed protein product [Rotaria socialis]CAF4259202.1 unnamed protein product [Rotaria socialis]